MAELVELLDVSRVHRRNRHCRSPTAEALDPWARRQEVVSVVHVHGCQSARAVVVESVLLVVLVELVVRHQAVSAEKAETMLVT